MLPTLQLGGAEPSEICTDDLKLRMIRSETQLDIPSFDGGHSFTLIPRKYAEKQQHTKITE